MNNEHACRFRAFIAAALVAVGPAAAAAGAQTSITVYGDGRVLVRRSVAAQVPKGTSSHRVALGPLDPSTLFSLDSGVVVVRALYDGATDETSVLRRSVGRRVVFRLPQTHDTLSALVLGVDPLRLQLPDGRISFTMPGTALYPADVVVVDPAVTLTVESARASDRLRVGYFTGDARWEADYNVTIGKQARVTGSAVLSTASLRFDDAEVQLLAGEVSRVARQPNAPEVRRRLDAQAAAERAMPQEERVGEYHLYSLPGRATLQPGLTTSIALFAPVQVAYKTRYVVRTQMPIWGIQPNEDQDVAVEVRYALQRPRKTEFGDRPLPEGVARVYQADSAGRPQLIGEALVRHTAPGHDLEVAVGNAFDLTARRVQTNLVQTPHSMTADYQVTLRNETDTAVTIDVLEERFGQWTVTASSVPPEKISSSVTQFRVTVPARGQTVLTYQIKVTM